LIHSFIYSVIQSFKFDNIRPTTSKLNLRKRSTFILNCRDGDVLYVAKNQSICIQRQFYFTEMQQNKEYSQTWWHMPCVYV